MARRLQTYGNPNGLPGLPRAVVIGNDRRHPVPPPRSQPTPYFRNPVRNTSPAMFIRPSAPPPAMPSGPDPVLSRRIDMLEQRLMSAEQSNRTLLDEIMRLQQELKTNVRKNELAIQEERDSRNRLEMTMRQSQGKIYETDERIRRNEDGVKENRGAIQQLSSHLNNMEKVVSANHQEAMERRSEHSQKLQSYQDTMEKLHYDKNMMERQIMNLRDDTKDFYPKLESLKNEVSTLQNNVRLQAQMMEEKSSKLIENPGVDKRMAENERIQMEGKLMKLNTALQQLSTRLNGETDGREKQRTELNSKINELKRSLDGTQGEKAKEQVELDNKLKELHIELATSEKEKIKMEMTSIANNLQSKIDENDRKIRRDTVEKLHVLEQTVLQENQNNKDIENRMRKELHDELEQLKAGSSENHVEFTDSMQTQMKKVQDDVQDIDGRLNDNELETRNNKLELDKVIAAEIKTRETEYKKLDSQIDDLDDRLKTGLLALQSSIGNFKNEKKKDASKPSNEAVPASYGLSLDEVENLQSKREEGIRTQFTDQVNGLDKRLSAVENNMDLHKREVDSRLKTSQADDKSAANVLGNQMQQQIDQMQMQQTKIKKNISELQSSSQECSKDIAELRTGLAEQQQKVSQDLEKERKERTEDIAHVQEELEKLNGKGQGDGTSLTMADLKKDLDANNTSLRKVAEALHVVKSSLTEKVSSEIQLREKEMAVAKADITRLENKVTEIKQNIKSITVGGEPDLDYDIE